MARASRILDQVRSRGVSALLGPTNTGKTHRAIQRMLGYRTGMIGLPLRLLAREVYDRVVVERGAETVALVTGEEKLIPRAPRYWVCTVEAMPVDRPVAFLAVDEVQLAADRTRGHVFTDRLLNARGLQETLFLGADTIAPLLHRLIPEVRLERHPRLSSLTHAGHRKLTSLPPRSAAIAFSVDRVYELAERLRARHGGTALVLGALSPRTRNAQVAMYQSREVQFMVATDAIGMGLNMDLDHVAFTAQHKYDGRGVRRLGDAELAQIAGRAGRWRRDGTFGTTTDMEPLEPQVIDALEGHRFPALTLLYWRTAELDYSSVEALVASLATDPPHPFLVPQRRAEDQVALEQVIRLDEVAARAHGEDRVRLLWEVCGIPDYRKTLTDSHADLLARVYRHLVDRGRLPEDWVSARIDRLDRVHGDIDALTTRIAFVRTWTTISYHSDWLDDARAWQERTRAIEDRLSDALHEQLTLRFVDQRAMAMVAGSGSQVAVSPGGEVLLGGEPLGALVGFRFRPHPAALRRGDPTRLVRRALGDEIGRRVARLLEAGDDDFHVGRERQLCWEGSPVARLEPGPALLEPKVRLLRQELVPVSDRRAIEARLVRWVGDRIQELTGPLRPTPALGAPARGLLYCLESSLGSVPRREVGDQVDALGPADRRELARLDVRLGLERVYARSLLSPPLVELRAILWGVAHGVEALIPAPDGPSAPADGPASFYEAVGYRILGPLAVRVDVAESVAAVARRAARRGPFRLPAEVPELLECELDQAAGVLQGLGFRVIRSTGQPNRFTRGRGRR